jgi:hypothetical protein
MIVVTLGESAMIITPKTPVRTVILLTIIPTSTVQKYNESFSIYIGN